MVSMDIADRSARAQSDIDVRKLLHELDELHELDRKRRLEPRGSTAYLQAVREVDRRSRALIDRLRVAPTIVRPRRIDTSRGQLA